MRKLLVSLVFVCVFTLATLGQSGGGTHEPGAIPTPTPTPCPAVEVCETEGGTNSGADATTPLDLASAFFDGVLVIFSLPS